MTYPHDLFKSTAPYYTRYRPPYPRPLFDHIITRFRLDGTGRMLDLGCGPGSVTIPLAPYVALAIGVDPEPEMLVEAQIQADEAGVKNIEWIEGSSDDLLPLRDRLGPLRLVTMGSSFHWMDREATLQALDALITPEGGLMTTGGYQNSWEQPGAWQAATTEVIRRWLGEQRRAGSGAYTQISEHHDAVIARSAFSRIETYRLEQQLTWDIERIIGYLYSTSYCSPAVLGDKREPFERDLRATLHELNPDGVFTEDVVLEAILAWRG